MTEPILVLGLGNPVMGDDGVGLAALEQLRAGFLLPKDVELADGGTWGMRLLPMLQDHDRVLFLDAIAAGKPPGTLVRLDGDAIPRGIGVGKLSPHQVDLQDVLAAATLLGRVPSQMVALGLQPERVEMRVGLSPAVEAQVDSLVAAAVECLAAWGAECQRLEVPAHA
ncbi:MAG: HyaD/HybD family hydrogenase maturation endopeptidase [Gemmatimonadales bacterium]|nr:HyaD/HybD family hydrogenase maturation endopeptidase [Gemmatimonadales bacterium]